MPKKKIIGISGSTRSKSTNGSILNIIGKMYNEVLDLNLHSQIADLPHFNPDLDNENVPLSVINFRKLIQQADGVIICTPEYVFSLPGALKNALEWTVSTTVFSNKPVALITASSLGEKAHESLLLIMKTLQARIGIKVSLLIQGVRSKVNSQDEVIDNKVLNEIEMLMKAFTEMLNEQDNN